MFELLAAVAPSLPLQILALVPLGAASVTFAAGVNSTLQLAAAPRDARARDVALLGRLPRLDADRRAARRLARRGRRRARARARGAAALVAAAGARFAYARWGEGIVRRSGRVASPRPGKAMPGATRASTSRGPDAEIASRSTSRSAPASSTRVLGTP